MCLKYFDRFFQQTSIFVLCTSLIFSCATTSLEYGTVIEKGIYSVGKIKEPIPLKERSTKAGLIGAKSGAVIGGAFGLFGSALTPSASALGFIVPFAAGGALVAGGAGLIIGSGIALGNYALTPVENDIWQYKVKSLSTEKVYIIKQQDPHIKLNSKVKITSKKGSLKIKSLS